MKKEGARAAQGSAYVTYSGCRAINCCRRNHAPQRGTVHADSTYTHCQETESSIVFSTLPLDILCYLEDTDYNSSPASQDNAVDT